MDITKLLSKIDAEVRTTKDPMMKIGMMIVQKMVIDTNNGCHNCRWNIEKPFDIEGIYLDICLECEVGSNWEGVEE